MGSWMPMFWARSWMSRPSLRTRKSKYTRTTTAARSGVEITPAIVLEKAFTRTVPTTLPDQPPGAAERPAPADVLEEEDGQGHDPPDPHPEGGEDERYDGKDRE